MNTNIVISKIIAGLGNQLFQYATGLTIARRNNAVLKLDLEFYQSGTNNSHFKLQHFNIELNSASEQEILELKNTEGPVPFFYKVLRKLSINNRYLKKSHILDSFAFKPSKKILAAKAPCYIDGWCVKEVYFRELKNELYQLFSSKVPLSQIAVKIQDQINGCNSVSIHIRRGDYINNEVFFITPISYYNKAIELVSEKVDDPVFFVFSDDIEWVKVNIKTTEKIIYVDLASDPSYSHPHDIEDFTLMKSCKHNIIANSSYSWWAAYLNQNEQGIVIYPKVWYKHEGYQQSIEKYPFMPESWICI